MVDAKMLVGTVFSGLSALMIEEIKDAGEVIVVRASTRGGAVECPACGTPTRRVHAFHERMPTDVPVDGRRVLLRVRVRRMRCRLSGCARQTFRERAPGLLERYERRTVRLREQLRAVVRELAGRASAQMLPVLGIAAGRDTALRTLLGIALPERTVPSVLGIDDFALRRSRNYATVLIDAATGQRIEVLAGRGAEPLTEWPHSTLLRRPVEYGQFTSVAFAETLALEGIAASMGSIGDAYDNALAESTIGQFKNEAIRDGSPLRTGPLRSIDDVEWVTAGWVDWYNNRRLQSTLDDLPPEEYEAAYYADLTTPSQPVLEPA